MTSHICFVQYLKFDSLLSSAMAWRGIIEVDADFESESNSDVGTAELEVELGQAFGGEKGDLDNVKTNADVTKDNKNNKNKTVIELVQIAQLS